MTDSIRWPEQYRWQQIPLNGQINHSSIVLKEGL